MKANVKPLKNKTKHRSIYLAWDTAQEENYLNHLLEETMDHGKVGSWVGWKVNSVMRSESKRPHWETKCIDRKWLSLFRLPEQDARDRVPQTTDITSHSCGNWEVQDQGVYKVGFILKSLFLACRWLSSHYMFTWPLCGHRREREGERMYMLALWRAHIPSWGTHHQDLI